MTPLEIQTLRDLLALKTQQREEVAAVMRANEDAQEKARAYLALLEQQIDTVENMLARETPAPVACS